MVHLILLSDHLIFITVRSTEGTPRYAGTLDFLLRFLFIFAFLPATT